MKVERQKYWVKRIVANGWDKMGASGLDPYLKKYGKKYGKNIGKDKLLAIARLVRNEGATALADAFEAKAKTGIGLPPAKKTPKINLPPSLIRPRSKSDVGELFGKVWQPSLDSFGNKPAIASSYFVTDSKLKQLIKNKIFPKDDKKGSGYGKPLLPSHNYNKFIRATDFEEKDDIWVCWIEGVEYKILKNK